MYALIIINDFFSGYYMYLLSIYNFLAYFNQASLQVKKKHAVFVVQEVLYSAIFEVLRRTVSIMMYSFPYTSIY